tara:strand:+ start:456 stop:1787 length:1332 start_codon:yes stop_codon:yes gene_type:complete
MAHNYSKGAQVIGDLKAADDAQRNTLIDFGEDIIDFQTSGSVRLQVSNDGVYIPDSPASTSLRVSGAVEITPGHNAGLTFNKGESELNFISFKNESDGASYNARMSYQVAEHLFIAPGRGADFYINASENSGDATFPFRIMDDGTARFEKGLTDGAASANNLATDISFYVSGTTDGNNNAVFVGNVVMSGGLNIHGDLEVAQKIIHAGDADTLITFNNNQIVLKAGNLALVTAEKNSSAPHEVTINDGANNVDFIVKGNGSNEGNPGMKFDASTNRLGINGVGTPDAELHVDGDIKATGVINAKQRSIMSHKYTYTNGSDAVFVRFNAAGSNTSGGVNNNFIAPTGGRLLKVLIRSDSTPGNTEIAFCKILNGTGSFGSGAPSGDVIINASIANTTYVADFSGLSSPHDITFSEGNVLGIRVNPTSNHGNVDVTTIWEFDWNS